MPGWLAAPSFLLLPLTPPAFAEFDPQFRNGAAPLAAQVQWTDGGHACTVDYEAVGCEPRLAEDGSGVALQSLRGGKFPLQFGNCDWTLNDAR